MNKFSPYHELTAIQLQFLNDTHRFIVITAGRRSYKTLGAISKVKGRAMRNSNKVYKFGAPTHQQAKAIFWENLIEFFLWTGYIINPNKDINSTDLTIKLRNKTQLKVVGLDKPERSEGTPCDGWLITEVPNLKSDVWNLHIRPTLSDTNGFCILEGVPEGLNFYYDMALYAAGGYIPKTLPYVGAYAENPDDPEWCFYSWFSSDVLLEKEIESAKRSLDERVFKQEYEGEFLKHSGLVYYAFDAALNHRPEVFNNLADTFLCFDFNVNPMTCLINQRIDTESYCVTKEFSLKNSNTEETCQIVTEYLTQQNFDGNLEITGDYTGHSNKSVGSSDYFIISEYFKNYKGFIRPKTKPTINIHNRTNALNSLFKTASGLVRQYINIIECKNLNKSLNTLQWASNSSNFEIKGIDASHAPDALSYFAYNYYPIRKEMTVRVF